MTTTPVGRLLATGEDLAQTGSWSLDLSSGETLWSAGMYRIMGLEPSSEARARPELLEFIHPHDRARIDTLLISVSERPEEVPEDGLRFEVRAVRPDGTTRQLRAHGRIERDARGRPARWVGVLQDVTDYRGREQELSAHHAVSETLREWDSFDEGVIDLLQRVGTALEYPMGSLWTWDGDQEALTCRAFWSEAYTDPGQFEYAKRSLVFRPGEGKPGVAWEKREPVVTPDAVTDPVFEPRDAAVMRGVRSGLAFPAVNGGEPAAVLSFYSLEHRVASESLVRTLKAIGSDLGRFLNRRRAHLAPQVLSGREIEVLHLAAEGNSGPQIAERLFISPLTVKSHFENIYEKMGVSDRTAAVAQAIRAGLIS